MPILKIDLFQILPRKTTSNCCLEYFIIYLHCTKLYITWLPVWKKSPTDHLDQYKIKKTEMKMKRIIVPKHTRASTSRLSRESGNFLFVFLLLTEMKIHFSILTFKTRWYGVCTINGKNKRIHCSNHEVLWCFLS